MENGLVIVKAREGIQKTEEMELHEKIKSIIENNNNTYHVAIECTPRGLVRHRM